jgi:hypothetical protein
LSGTAPKNMLVRFIFDEFYVNRTLFFNYNPYYKKVYESGLKILQKKPKN